jgi:hypothetical protein
VHVLTPVECNCLPPDLGAPGLAIAGAVANLPDTPHWRPILAPRDAHEDRNFEAMARVADVEADLADLERFINDVEAAGDVFEDVIDNDPFEDVELMGRVRRGRR